MNTCTSTVENCTHGKNWVRFFFEVEGYDPRPVKNQPIGPWWDDSHGLGHVSVLAYIPLQNSTVEEAEAVLREYWPKTTVILETKVDDTPRFTRNYTCPKWWSGDNILVSC